jgi:thioredoxin-like negative regulator of GroEL
VRFVIKNTTGTAVGPPIQVLVKPEKIYTKLEGVKESDTMGVHDVEVPTNAAFLAEVDTDVSGQVLKQATEAIAGLPAAVLKAADSNAAEGDDQGAAEQYMLYLNSTENTETPERKRAQKFLLDNYNFQSYGESAPQT